MRVEPLRGRFGGDQRHEKIERRRVYFFQSRELERRYELRLEFHRPASLVVLQHRGLVRRAGRGRAARPAFWTMRRLVDGDAQGARDGATLRRGALGKRLELGTLLYLAHRKVSERAQGGSPQVLRELA